MVVIMPITTGLLPVRAIVSSLFGNLVRMVVSLGADVGLL
jgi:hypothetical protein